MKNISGYINHKLMLLLILVFGHFVIALPLFFMYVLSFLIWYGFFFVGLLCFAEELCRAPISWAFCYSHCILVLYQSWWPCSIGGRDEWKPLAVFQVTLCFPWYHTNLVLGFFHLCNTVCSFSILWHAAAASFLRVLGMFLNSESIHLFWAVRVWITHHV